MTRSDLLQRLSARIVALGSLHPVRVALDGVDAAGKTTLADELVEPLRHRGREVIRASVDGFHNPAAVRLRCGALSADGYYRDSFNHEALRGALLEPLGPGGSRRYRRRVFDHRVDAPVDAPEEIAAVDAILLFDGIFLLRPELRDLWDYSIFVHADFAVTTQRAETRDEALFGSVEEVRRRYRARYVPGQELYLAEACPQRHASVVVDNNDPTQPLLLEKE